LKNYKRPAADEIYEINEMDENDFSDEYVERTSI